MEVEERAQGLALVSLKRRADSFGHAAKSFTTMISWAWDWRDAPYVVTGGSRGIGLAIVSVLLDV
ncbi:hypothetical protein GCM10010178_15140 [Lentzea flava]|uniref:Short chain dehydrogenase n=1 Tax=Lentzea flava TaxID=103732 RepID=A0ABQ2UD69_9PSEU|nr:hypothetical protein [Lentzea flava]GGU23922.1 hypothetical protein GCM10010178_15140 [Lentzea flava]